MLLCAVCCSWLWAVGCLLSGVLCVEVCCLLFAACLCDVCWCCSLCVVCCCLVVCVACCELVVVCRMLLLCGVVCRC